MSDKIIIKQSDNDAKKNFEDNFDRIFRGKKHEPVIVTDNSKVNAGLLDRIAELEANKKWVSVDDYLPEKHDWYLVYQGDNRFCREYKHAYWVNSKEFKYGNVTHWATLQEPPKEGK